MQQPKYQLLSELHAIFLRPEAYAGSDVPVTETLYVPNNAGDHMEQESLHYNPVLLKVLDELVCNAVDQHERHPTKTTQLKVTLASNHFIVWNNGPTIAVKIDQDVHVTAYLPTVLFSMLHSGSNFDDTQDRKVGGKNGLGCKLPNIFAIEMIVECNDVSQTGLHFSQRFSDHMTKSDEPKISKAKGSSDFTRVTVYPDFGRFKMQAFDTAMTKLIRKRVFDLAGTTGKGFKCYFNDELVKVQNFKQYVSLFLPEAEEQKGDGTDETEEPAGESKEKKKVQAYVYEKFSDDWEIAVAMSTSDEFEAELFVNHLWCTQGGTPIKYILNKLDKLIMTELGKRRDSSKLNITSALLKRKLRLFVCCKIVNPDFKTQTKVECTTLPENFGSTCELSEAFAKRVLKNTGLLANILEAAREKEDATLSKKLNGKKARRIKNHKLEDAHKAGTKQSLDCTLFLTEGDSANSLARAGISVIGRDLYGNLPLKGKILNVRDVKSTTTVLKNAEIKAIFEALGLNKDHDYSDDKKMETLRYGHVAIMSDQDPDGSHIMGLVVNLFDHYAPTLIRRPGFLKRFITPIVKATKGTHVLAFFSLQEFEHWKKTDSQAHHYKIKYYKGLGTSTEEEAVEYFSDLRTHMKIVDYDLPLAPGLVKLSFAKSMADARKKCLGELDPEAHLDYDQTQFKLSDFISKELMQFWAESNNRAIPSIMDGLKPGQRKILYTCFNRKSNSEIKVAQLQGEVAKQSAYHHGEDTLGKTIVGMAQNFVGSKNINLLQPRGMFGTRINGGKDAASSRYIFTCMSPLARAIFPETDDAVLKRNIDDGVTVEPVYYAAIVPLCLINGASGVGTGWATEIPNHDAKEIVYNVLRMLDGQQPLPMQPKYKGFTGTISPNTSLAQHLSANGKDEKAPGTPLIGTPVVGGKKMQVLGYTVTGVVHKRSPTTLEITDLPVDVWPKDYKIKLGKLMEKNVLKHFKEDHTKQSLSFTLTLSEDQMAAAEKKTFIKAFELESSLSISNMVLFGVDGKLYKYASSIDILKEFFQQRLHIYGLRKEHLIQEMERLSSMLQNKVRFIQAIVDEELRVKGLNNVQLVQRLIADKYTPFPKQNAKRAIQIAGDIEMDVQEESKDEADEKENGKISDYAYLTSMSIANLTLDKVAKLKLEYEAQQAELARLKLVDLKDMWRQDLRHFLDVLEQVEKQEQENTKQALSKKRKRETSRPKTKRQSQQPSKKKAKVKA